jgi:hypothetical protein
MPLGNKISASTKKSAIRKTIFCETFARSADFFRALQRLCARVQALAAIIFDRLALRHNSRRWQIHDSQCVGALTYFPAKRGEPFN